MKIEKALNRIVELLEERLPEPLGTGDLFSEWNKEDEDVYLSDLLKNMPLDYEDEDFEIELDMDDIFTNKMLVTSPLLSFTLETITPKKIDNRTVEIEVDTSELSDWLESMNHIIADYNSYEEEDYYYVVLPDPNNTDNLTRVLMRNENYDPIIEGIYLAPGEDMLDIMFEDGNFDFLFTEEEIKASHPYLWECRKAF